MGDKFGESSGGKQVVLMEIKNVAILMEIKNVAILMEIKNVAILMEIKNMAILMEIKNVAILIEIKNVAILLNTKNQWVPFLMVMVLLHVQPQKVKRKFWKLDVGQKNGPQGPHVTHRSWIGDPWYSTRLRPNAGKCRQEDCIW